MWMRATVILTLALAALAWQSPLAAQPTPSKPAPARTPAKAPAATPAKPAPARAPAATPTKPAPAEEPPAEVIPETVAGKHRKAVFDAYVHAARDADWQKAAGYFDPAALANLHEMMTTIIQAASAKGEDKELFALFGATTADAYAKQSPNETFAGFMDGLAKMVPTLKEAIANAEFQYLGEVAENENLVHIVYRTRVKVDDVVTAKIAASSMSKTPGGWRLQLDAEIEGFAKMLKQQFVGDDAEAPKP